MRSALTQRLRTVRYPVVKLLLLPALVLVAWLLYCWDLGCLWQRLLGIPCPGCGMSRALLALLQGNIRSALEYHVMFPSLPVFYLYILFDGRPFRRRWLNITVLGIILLGFLLHWLWLLFAM